MLREQASGADTDRSVLSQLRQFAREHSIHALIIYHPDRLSRDATDLMVLSDEMAGLGVQLLFVHGPSGSSPEDRLLRYIFGYKSETERRDTTERTMRGKRKTASNGKLPTGAGAGLYGYRYKWFLDEEVGRPRLVSREIIPDEATVVRKVFDLCISGVCVYEIARRLNEQGITARRGGMWHPLTVKRMLTNTGYMGVTYYGKERVTKVKNSTKRIRTPRDQSEWIAVKGFTPLIVHGTTFELAQQKLAEPKSRTGKAIEPYLLSGHILCGHCNTPMVGSTLNRKYRYYRCRGTYNTATEPKHCQASYIPYAKLEEAVWGIVVQVLDQPEVVLAEMTRLLRNQQGPINEDIARLTRQIKVCEDQEVRLVKLYQFGEVDDNWIQAQSGPLKLRRESHQAELEQMLAQKNAIISLEGFEHSAKQYCLRMRQGLESLDFESKREALKALQVKATVTETEVRVKGILGEGPDQHNLATTARTSA